MEPKKNPKYDIHQKRGIIFNVSLLISLSLVITAFEWTVKVKKVPVARSSNEAAQIEMVPIPIVYEKQKEAPLPRPLKQAEPKPVLEAINLKAVSDAEKIEESRPTDIDQNRSPMIEIPFSVEILPETAETTVFRIVEKMPEPAGGWATFFNTLKKHMKYPRQAERVGASGKVFVAFTVNEKGELQDFSIEKSVGFGCDEEAMRVLALTKWNPGKQRGRPVKVRLVQPINFSITTP